MPSNSVKLTTVVDDEEQVVFRIDSDEDFDSLTNFDPLGAPEGETVEFATRANLSSTTMPEF